MLFKPQVSRCRRFHSGYIHIYIPLRMGIFIPENWYNWESLFICWRASIILKIKKKKLFIIFLKLRFHFKKKKYCATTCNSNTGKDIVFMANFMKNSLMNYLFRFLMAIFIYSHFLWKIKDLRWNKPLLKNGRVKHLSHLKN